MSMTLEMVIFNTQVVSLVKKTMSSLILTLMLTTNGLDQFVTGNQFLWKSNSVTNMTLTTPLFVANVLRDIFGTEWPKCVPLVGN